MNCDNRVFKISLFITATVFILFIFMYIYGIDRFWSDKSEDSIAAMETTIRQSAMQCYALEGAYPPDLKYLQDNYGLIVNEKQFFYHYDLQASNVMPNIKVVKNWD